MNTRAVNMELDIIGQIIGLLTSLGLAAIGILKRKDIWKYFTSKNDNSTSTNQSILDHQHRMQERQLDAEAEDTKQIVKILTGQLKALEEKMGKHENRISQLESERVDFIAKVTSLEGELNAANVKAARLETILDNVEGILIDKKVDPAIINLIKTLR